MAFDKLQLGQIQSVNGFAHYRYDSLDPATTVDGSGYMNDASDYLRVGDLIYAFDWLTAVRTGTITDVSLHVVSSNTGGVVNLSTDLLGATVTVGD